MDIIKRGKIPNEKPWHGECKNCCSKIRANKSELDIEYDQRESGELGRGVCPVCHVMMIFYPKE